MLQKLDRTLKMTHYPVLLMIFLLVTGTPILNWKQFIIILSLSLPLCLTCPQSFAASYLFLIISSQYVVSWGGDGKGVGNKRQLQQNPGPYLPKERKFENVRNVPELSEVHGFSLMNYETYDLCFCYFGIYFPIYFPYFNSSMIITKISWRLKNKSPPLCPSNLCLS